MFINPVQRNFCYFGGSRHWELEKIVQSNIYDWGFPLNWGFSLPRRWIFAQFYDTLRLLWNFLGGVPHDTQTQKSNWGNDGPLLHHSWIDALQCWTNFLRVSPCSPKCQWHSCRMDIKSNIFPSISEGCRANCIWCLYLIQKHARARLKCSVSMIFISIYNFPHFSFKNQKNPSYNSRYLNPKNLFF